MPDESTRKRSRSPSDSEQKKNHKRPNTGAYALDGPSASSVPQASDVTMIDSSQTATVHSGDTNSSTPTSNGVEAKKDDKTKDDKDAATTSGEPSSTTSPPAPTANIHMRCLIVTQDASIIIGKGGSHVNEIREKSGARVMVSESIPGNPERILNVSGPLDAVSKVCFLVYGFIISCAQI